jgi:Pirin-related protein
VKEDLAPSYQQISFDPQEKDGRFRLLAGPKKDNERVVTINQDARLFVAELRAMESARHSLAPRRYAWVQVLRGNVSLNGSRLNEGDGAAVSDDQELQVTGDAPDGGEVLLFDLQ